MWRYNWGVILLLIRVSETERKVFLFILGAFSSSDDDDDDYYYYYYYYYYYKQFLYRISISMYYILLLIYALLKKIKTSNKHEL